MSSRDSKEMSRKRRSSPSRTGSSPTPTLDFSRKPIVLRYNSDFFETSSVMCLTDDSSSSSSPPPVDQVSRISLSDSRINLSESRNSLTRASEHTLNTIGSWVSDNTSNASFPFASDIPGSPSPICSTASSAEGRPLLSQQFQMNPLDPLSKQEIAEKEEKEEKIDERTRSRFGSIDGLSVKSTSYTKGTSVRTRNRNFHRTVSNSSSTTEYYYDSNSILNSPMVLGSKQSDKMSVGYPKSKLSKYRDSDNPRRSIKQKGKGYFGNLFTGIRQRKVAVKLGDRKEAKGKRYYNAFISRIWRRKVEMKPDDRKEAKSAELQNILRKREESIDARRSEKIDLAKQVWRETEEILESEKRKAEAKMQKKITSAEKKADDSKAKVRELTDKKISKVVGNRSWWKSLFNH